MSNDSIRIRSRTSGATMHLGTPNYAMMHPPGWRSPGQLIYIHDESKRTFALGLLGFQDLYATQWNLMMAASAVLILPVVAVFRFAQRYFIRGISLTGLAGR